MFSAGPTVLLLTLGTLTSIQARQGHPGRHTLGVQLESTRQRILAGGGLQEGSVARQASGQAPAHLVYWQLMHLEA
jgi:hypothetical protein